MTSFSDSKAAARYAEGPARQVPGFHDLQRMTTILLTEKVPTGGQVLVVGAGGGLELKVFAEAQPTWSFCGVDPSAAMLDQAKIEIGPLAGRVDFHLGLTQDAPSGPFDGATCLLVMHFLTRAERLATLKAIHDRLKPGSPLVLAHRSQSDTAADQDLRRSVMFGHPEGVSVDVLESSVATMKARLTLMFADAEVALLREAGFVAVEMFYSVFGFKGWVAIRP
jgi:tRNA (cmo5U34)-methyltransferase